MGAGKKKENRKRGRERMSVESNKEESELKRYLYRQKRNKVNKREIHG